VPRERDVAGRTCVDVRGASHIVVSLPAVLSSSLTMWGHRGMTSCFRQESRPGPFGRVPAGAAGWPAVPDQRGGDRVSERLRTSAPRSAPLAATAPARRPSRLRWWGGEFTSSSIGTPDRRTVSAQIVHAAIHVLDEGGVDALTFRMLASRLSTGAGCDLSPCHRQGRVALGGGQRSDVAGVGGGRP